MDKLSLYKSYNINVFLKIMIIIAARPKRETTFKMAVDQQKMGWIEVVDWAAGLVATICYLWFYFLNRLIYSRVVWILSDLPAYVEIRKTFCVVNVLAAGVIELLTLNLSHLFQEWRQVNVCFGFDNWDSFSSTLGLVSTTEGKCSGWDH